MRQALAQQMAKWGDLQLLALNTTLLEGKTLTLLALQTACQRVPFLAPYCVVQVENWLANKPSADLTKTILAYLPNLPPTTQLIFLENQTVREGHALHKLATSEAQGQVQLFQLPKGAQLEGWIRQQVQQRQSQIAPAAVQWLAVNVGNDLPALENEIEKLTLYAPKIGLEEVQKLSPYSATSNIFDLVDALGQRRSQRAGQLLQKQIEEGGDPFYLFAMFVRQFRLLLQIRDCLDRREPSADLPKLLGVHPFVAQKLSQQAQRFTLQQLGQIYRQLLEIDLAVKSGKTDMETALTVLVAQLAQ